MSCPQSMGAKRARPAGPIEKVQADILNPWVCITLPRRAKPASVLFFQP